MIQTVVNKKGEATKQESKLLVNLRIRPEDLEAVRTAGIDRPPPAGEDSAPEKDEEASTA
jgi:hypothetical protein